MKQLGNFQEVGPDLDQGKTGRFQLAVKATVDVQVLSDEEVMVTTTYSLGDVHLGKTEIPYPSLDAVLEAYQIDEREEIWQIFS